METVLLNVCPFELSIHVIMISKPPATQKKNMEQYHAQRDCLFPCFLTMSCFDSDLKRI